MKHLTGILLLLTVLCGLGIGMLSPFSGGIFSAICLFLLPALAGLTFLAVLKEARAE